MKKNIREIENHQRNASEWMARNNLAEAEEAVNQMLQIAHQYPDLAAKLELQAMIANLRLSLAQYKQFKPAYLETLTLDATTDQANPEGYTVQGYRYELLRPLLRLGRRSKEQGIIQELDLIDLGSEAKGKTVSRTHAYLTYRDGAWRIKSAPNASNGTFVNDIALAAYEEYALENQDVIRLGKVILRIHLPDQTFTDNKALTPQAESLMPA